MNADELVELVEKVADDNALELSQEDWLDACEQLSANFDVKAEATREELLDTEQ